MMMMMMMTPMANEALAMLGTDGGTPISTYVANPFSPSLLYFSHVRIFQHGVSNLKCVV